MIRDVEQAGAWLEGLINMEKRTDWPYARLGLEPVRRLLARLGDPQEALHVVHLAGSKGKGSTALLAESVWLAAGGRVGTYTSPHLERWTERVRLDGRETDGALLAAAVEAIRPHVEELRDHDPASAPTFFDALTAAAFVCFREAGVENVILEVGLGGRLDSTNVVTPRVTGITSIELEHTDKLGNTLGAIAGEKAGILKPGVPAVAGLLPEEALAVVVARARELGAPLAVAGRDFRFELDDSGPGAPRLRLADGGLELEVPLPFLGRHQALNAALAVACLRRGSGLGDATLAEAAARGLPRARLAGRIERVGEAPLRIVDSAHTEASARSLAEALRQLPRRRTHVVLSISAGKHLDAILEALLPLASQVTVTRAEAVRSLAPEEVAAAVRRRAPDLALRVVPNPHLALRAACQGLGEGDCVCATGSVYLAGIARRVLAASDPAAGVAVSRGATSASRG
ncbi:MAG: folylpolyglutamate synthase/dihydrofolate synthase family protein [Myxococcota bacterium]|nr:folylpolyglutamate synthase/dihydrofolate synthase family protein [Myxococcota bacterium]